MNEKPQPQAPHWEAFWNQESNHDYWERPAQSVIDFVASLSPQTHPRVLDLGCGLGRHAVLFAAEGFNVTATDISAQAIAHLQRWAAVTGLEMDTQVCDALGDGYPPASFDVVISYNVIYHGTREEFAARIQHVHDLLRPGGMFFMTCHSRRDQKYGEGEMVAPHTYLSPNSITPGDMHYFTDEADLQELLKDFTIQSIQPEEYTWDFKGTPRFASNYIVIARR